MDSASYRRGSESSRSEATEPVSLIAVGSSHRCIRCGNEHVDCCGLCKAAPPHPAELMGLLPAPDGQILKQTKEQT